MRSFGEALIEGARDYRFLLDRGYPERSTILLVGNRRRLDAEERLMLFRGVASRAASERRRARLRGGPPAGSVAEPGAPLLLLDAYNLAFTLIHYRLGKPCFLSSDGLLRDAGANYGRLSRDELLTRAFGELADFLAGRPLSVEAYLDSPVSRSAAHAAELRSVFAAAGIEARVELARSADGAILARVAQLSGPGDDSRRAGPGSAAAGDPPCLVASSDSLLVEGAPAAWDLAREMLETGQGALFPDFGALLDAGARGDQARV